MAQPPADSEAARPHELALVFTGHMIDLPGRPVARFPAKLEPLVTDVLTRYIGGLSQAMHGAVIGIASGARGGDIIFLETCRDLGLDTYMVLPKDPDAFLLESVTGLPAGDWEDRFDSLWMAHGEGEREVIAPDGTGDAFARCNRRMLEVGGRLARRVVLLALADGRPGDGPGGTADFAAEVAAAGGTVERIDLERLLRALEEAGG